MVTMGTGLPIETAPRDGREFLAYDPVARKFDVCAWVERAWLPAGEVESTQSDSEYGPLDDEFKPERAALWWSLPNG